MLYGRLHIEYPLIKSHGNLTISYQDFFEQKDNPKVENDYKMVIKTTQDKVTARALSGPKFYTDKRGLSMAWNVGSCAEKRLFIGSGWLKNLLERL